MAKAKHTPYWFAVIRNAKKREQAGKPPFTEIHREKASSWVTCACGKQDSKIPRGNLDGSAVPLDPELLDLGESFNFFVADADPDEALATLLKIEQRSAEILAELDKR